MPTLGVPFLAASLPLAAAAGIGAYGVFGDEIARLINSFLGKPKLIINRFSNNVCVIKHFPILTRFNISILKSSLLIIRRVIIHNC